MTLSLADLKKNRAENLLKNKQKFSVTSDPKSAFKDDRYWKPTADKAGNGYAVIRFLPPQVDGVDAYVSTWSHYFEGPSGQVYNEKCLSTLSKDDPVMALNRQLWNTGKDSDKDVARKQKRKLHFYSNIYVVKDPNAPENEGKVFIFRYGKKIFDKLNASMNPELDDETPVDPFDLWGGANFKIKFTKGQYGPDYSDSKFLEAAPLFKDDKEIDKVFKQTYDLSEIVDPKSFKSYEDLERRLNVVLGGKSSGPVVEAPVGKIAEAPKFEESDEEDLTTEQIDDILDELDDMVA